MKYSNFYEISIYTDFTHVAKCPGIDAQVTSIQTDIQEVTHSIQTDIQEVTHTHILMQTHMHAHTHTEHTHKHTHQAYATGVHGKTSLLSRQALLSGQNWWVRWRQSEVDGVSGGKSYLKEVI